MAASSVSNPTRIASQTGYLLAGNLFTLAAGLPLQIYISRTLGASGLGMYGLLEAVAAVLMGVLGLGVAQTAVRFIPHHIERQEFDAVRRLVRGGIAVILLAGVAGYAMFAAGHGVFVNVWPEFEGHGSSILLYALTLPLGLFLHFLAQCLRGLLEVRQVVIATSFLQFSIKAAIAVSLLGLGLGLYGYIAAIVASQLIATGWLAWTLLRQFSLLPRGDAPTAGGAGQNWLQYARVMYAGSLLSVSASHLDRFLIGFLVNPAMVGILMIAKTLHGLPAVFLQLFIIAAGPLFAAANAREDGNARQTLYHLTTDWLVRLGAPLILFLALFAEPVLRLFGEEFAREGVSALWLLLLGQAVNLGSGQIGNLLNMSGLERAMLRISVQSTALLLLALPPLVYGFGIAGAAAALSASIVYNNLAALFVARREIGLRWSDARYRQWVAPGLAATAVAVLLRMNLDAPGAAVLVAALLAVYAVFHAAHLAQGLNDEDRQLWSALQARLRVQRQPS